MRLVNHHNGVVFKQKVLLYLLQQDAISHELDLGLRSTEVFRVKPDLVANFLSQLCLHFVRNALGKRHSSNSSRLRDSHHDLLVRVEVSELPRTGLSRLVDELRDLSGLSTACLSADNCYDEVLDVLHDFAFVHNHGKV